MDLRVDRAATEGSPLEETTTINPNRKATIFRDRARTVRGPDLVSAPGFVQHCDRAAIFIHTARRSRK